MEKKQTLIICILLLPCLFILFSGCGKITKENYDKIEMGMEYETVVGFLGEPDGCESVLGAKSCIWGAEEKHITIKFLGDKVIFFSSKGI